ncbi:MAG: ankyrin repeat domain-containing protein [Planctomycetota bacterium]
MQEALHFAVTHGELQVAAFLLEHGASVNGVSRGHHCETPLAQAIFVSEFDAARWLHARGADSELVDGKRGESARAMAKGRIDL